MAPKTAIYLPWPVSLPKENPWGMLPVTKGRPPGTRARERAEQLDAQLFAQDTPARRHHYVPQTYMRRWSDDGKRVWILDTATGAARHVGVRDICYARDLYRIVDAKGALHNRVELLYGVFDSEMSSLLRTFSELADPELLSIDDFMSLGLIMSIQRNRTLQSRRLDGAQAEWMRGQPTNPLLGQDTQATPLELAGAAAHAMIHTMYEAADVLTIRQLEIWDDPRGRFVTCDNPVMVPFQNGTRPDLGSAPEVIWPISPHRAICLSTNHQGRKGVMRRANNTMVQRVRETALQGRERMLITKKGQLPDLPQGKPLPRRPQLHIRCEPTTALLGTCIVDIATGYGTAPSIEPCANHLHVDGMDSFA